MSAPEFPRPFGVPPLPNELSAPLEGEQIPARTASRNAPSSAALAGPESAAEHLRNALMIVESAERWGHVSPAVRADPVTEGMVKAGWVLLSDKEFDAVRRRVAAALALLEGK